MVLLQEQKGSKKYCFYGFSPCNKIKNSIWAPGAQTKRLR